VCSSDLGAPIHALEFPQRVAQLAAELRGNERSTGRALDIGCAVVSCFFKNVVVFVDCRCF
jgi:hypothetical protein